MARSWLIDVGGFAKKVKSSSLPSAEQIKDCGAYRECPNCHWHIDNSDVFPEWPGFPVGVKFDPSDLELLEHLAAKCGVGNAEPHMFIHEFIRTLEGDEGICYTHPENLPGILGSRQVQTKCNFLELCLKNNLFVSGAKKDGSSVHFFHRTSNAYASGQRKRRKIHHHQGATQEHVRWHKTGKTKSVIGDGIHKGFKKIMVLYVRPEKGSKPYKSHWVMHQYHLGTEEEKDGEYVVSKVFYQKKQLEKNEENPFVEESENTTSRTSPRTPNPNPCNPPRRGNSADHDDNFDEKVLLSFNKDAESIPGEPSALPIDVQDEVDTSGPPWLAGESQAVDVESTDFDGLEDLLCNEILDSCAQLNDSRRNSATRNDFASNTNSFAGNDNASSLGISDLDNLELGTPPDFQLSNLQFCSQDSIFDWIDRL